VHTLIVLAALPRFARELLTEIFEAEEDMQVVGHLPIRRSLARRIQRSHADVVVLGREDPKLVARLLARPPCLVVIDFSGDANQATLYRLKPQVLEIPGATPRRLVEVIRDTACSGNATTWSSR
jgi:DNA-binding NarL/FixJ family response regulator